MEHMEKVAIVTVLNNSDDLGKLKSRIADVICGLINDDQYTEEDAAKELQAIFVGMTELEMDMIRELKEKTPSID